MEIIPAVLAKTESELAEIKNKLGSYSGPLHIDIADGQFVPTLTVGREEIEKYFPKQILDVHLMVANPADVIPLWLDMPNVRTIIFHIEATDKAPEIIDTIHQAGKKVGIAINPETEAPELKADVVHFMAVHPGNYGGEFIESVVGKITDFHTRHPGVFISADGGVTPKNVSILEKAGVSVCIAGSYIQNSEDSEKAFKKLSEGK